MFFAQLVFLKLQYFQQDCMGQEVVKTKSLLKVRNRLKLMHTKALKLILEVDKSNLHILDGQSKIRKLTAQMSLCNFSNLFQVTSNHVF